ncbi:hypothetical protein GS461_09800 [Rhodococcus hoagii]|nr:hypothetical protein [Prescottella equi]NKS66372.1 hypothetical protein [Prescottella equi]
MRDHWIDPELVAARHAPHVTQPRLDSTDDPWGWAARGITNPDKETQR